MFRLMSLAAFAPAVVGVIWVAYALMERVHAALAVIPN